MLRRLLHRGAGVVAVDGLLDVFGHTDRNVFREVGGHPLRPIGRAGDDEFFLVFGKQGTIEEVHVLSLFRFGL
jgi:hypothetical protein